MALAGKDMLAAGLLATHPGLYPPAVDLAARLIYARRVISPADITLATAYQTVLPVRLFGTGRLFSFPQHYEPLLKDDSVDPYLAEVEAEASYDLRLTMIANSTWLMHKLQKRLPGARIHLCVNAIDHQIFSGMPKRRAAGQDVRIISYGERRLWKGFQEMAEAVRIVRDSLRGLNIRWLVYGNPPLAPRNEIADFDPLGFLQPPALAKAYAMADILLSASWYESFPLFPIEAMACGLPVITTQPGTEDYAIPSETAEIVEPRTPRSIADGLIRLIRDPDFAARVAAAGWEMSKRFTWERSVATMESILLENGPRPATPIRNVEN